jgi:ERCC4-type nuclease
MNRKVIIDTKEKSGYWDYENSIFKNLKTGDYTLEGLEEHLCIERKKTTGEIANNASEKRFIKQLTRMKNYPHRYILFEFSLDDVLRFPEGSTIPKKIWPKLRINGQFLYRFIIEMSVFYGIQTFFCGDKENAMLVAEKIMNRVERDYDAKR